MYKTVLYALFLIFFQVLPESAYTQTSGSERQVPSFRRLEVSGSISAVVEKGGVNSITSSGRRDNLDSLSVTLVGDTLVIRESPGMLFSRRTEIIITAGGKISAVEANRGARVRIFSGIFEDHADIRALSGSFADIFGEASTFNLDAGRNSRITIRGSASVLDARAYDSGEIYAFELEAEKVYAYARSGGSVRVKALKLLEAGAGRGSEIYYKGEPETLYFSEVLGGSYIKTD